MELFPSPWIETISAVTPDHAYGLITPVFLFAVLPSLLAYYCALSVYNVYRKTEVKATPLRSPPLMTAAIVAYAAYSLNGTLFNVEGSGSGLTDLILGTDPKLERVLELAPSIKRGPQPPLFLSNRHLQFIPWMLQNEIFNGGAYGIPYEQMTVTIGACERMDGAVTPLADGICQPHFNETLPLDIYPKFGGDLPDDAPVVLFAPGLRCHSQDMPGNTIVRHLSSKGIRSIVVNRRGHVEPLSAPRWNIFGDVDDLEQVYFYIKDKLLPKETPMFLHGISSGCAVVVAALSEWDRRMVDEPDRRVPIFVGAVTVTPGYDTSKVFSPSRFQWPYNPLMLDAVKGHFVRRNEAVLRKFNDTAVDRALAARDLQEFLDECSTFAGYSSSSEYYRWSNPVNDLHKISTPVYVLNSADDPCCHINNLYEKSKSERHGGRSYAQIVADSKRGLVAVTSTGSHCPFLDSPLFIQDPLKEREDGGLIINSWADTSIVEFYRAATKVYAERALDGYKG